MTAELQVKAVLSLTNGEAAPDRLNHTEFGSSRPDGDEDHDRTAPRRIKGDISCDKDVSSPQAWRQWPPWPWHRGWPPQPSPFVDCTQAEFGAGTTRPTRPSYAYRLGRARTWQ